MKIAQIFREEDDNLFDVDELLDEVNKFDKSFGLKLKHPVWDDPKEYKGIITSKTDFGLAGLLCVINGIDANEYITTSKNGKVQMLKYPVSPYYPKFMFDSSLDWESNKTFDTSSLTFKVRYLSVLLSYLIGKTTRITKEYIRSQGYTHSNDERSLVFLKEFMKDIITFINLMISPDSTYNNMILKINQYLSYTDKRIKSNKLHELLNGHVINLRKSMESNILTNRFADDDMCIFMLLKIAYMLATNKTNLKVIPKFRFIEGATVKHDLVKLIEELGLLILENTHEESFSIGFIAYSDARPKIKTDWVKESKDNYPLKVGIIALGYTAFVMNDKHITKFINEMLKKGI